LNQITDALTNVFNTIAMLNARIFNHSSTVTIAKRANVNYAATLSEAGRSVGGVGDKAKKSTQAVKELQRSLMGFDELNTLSKQSEAATSPTPTTGSGGGAASAGMPSYGSMFKTVKVPGWVNKVGNVTDIIGNWWKSLTNAQKWGAGIGGTAGFIIGGIIGNLIGGPIGKVVGAALGAAAGVAIGAWWASLTTPEKWAAGIGAGAGAVIGGIIGHMIGGKVGAIVGSTLGALVGGIAGKWWADLTTPEKWSAGIGAGAGATVGGIIGGILTAGNPIGIAVGIALGGTVGAIVGKWWSSFTAADKWGVGAGGTAGAVVGGIIGTMVAPRVGTVVGALIGGTAGTAISAALIKANSSINFQPMSDKVSQGTQAALSKFDALYKGADSDLKQLEWSGDTVTKDMAGKIKKNVDGMASQTIAAFNKQRDDSISAIKELSTKGSGITKTEMDKMVKDVNTGYDSRIKTEQDAQNKINKILENASTQKRGLTASETSEIDKLKADMYSNGVKALSKNQVEEQAIYDNMRVNHTATSAQEAADIVKNSKETTDKVIKDANDTYDQRVAAIIRERDETHTISSDEADKLIKAAGKERDEKVKAAQDGHKKVVDEAKTQAGELADSVDWDKGQVKSKWTVGWEKFEKVAQDKWGDINRFFGTALPDWWNKNIAPWFTKEKWQTLGKQAVDAVLGPFKNIHWPKISTPHLSWAPGGWKSTGWIHDVLDALHLPTQMPKLNVEWYAKGGIFDTPTIAGIGEAGPEAALPLNDEAFSRIAKGIVKNSGSSDGKADTDRILDRMDKMEHAIENIQVFLYTDDKKIAESANRGNRILGRTSPTAT